MRHGISTRSGTCMLAVAFVRVVGCFCFSTYHGASSKANTNLLEAEVAVDEGAPLFQERLYAGYSTYDQIISEGQQTAGRRITGEHTVWIRGDSPENLGGPRGWIHWFCCCVALVLVGLLILHEAVTWRSDNLPFKCHDRTGMQLSYYLWWATLMMEVAILIPTSYDLALHMGCSATVSGMYLGSSYLSAPLFVFLGGYLFKRVPQRTSRAVCLFGSCTGIVANTLCAWILDADSHHGTESMWLLLTVRFFLGGFERVTYMSQYMTYKVTAPAKRLELSILTVVFTNAGLFAGPLFAAASFHAMGGEENVPSVYTRTSACFYIMAALWALQTVAFALTIPLELEPLLPPETAILSSKRVSIPEQNRKGVVFHGMCFTAERCFAVAAIEAGSAMILEVQFDWGLRAIGVGISGVFLLTMFVCTSIMIAQVKLKLNEVHVLLTCCLVSVMGVILLFDFKNHSALQILLADALIYPFLFCANGISDGLATRVGVPGTFYSSENYLVMRGLTMGPCRFVGFFCARFLIDIGGRNLYACVQLALGLSALVASLRICWHLEWEGCKEIPDGQSGQPIEASSSEDPER